MNKAIKIFYQGLSIALYPMLIPTYGMAMFFTAYSNNLYPLSAGYAATACAATLFFTCLLPLGMILLMRRRGEIDSIYLTERTQRLKPYMYSIAGFIVWCFFTGYTLHAPLCVVWTSIGATTAIAIVSLVNLKWKISAHLCAMGGLAGGIMSCSLSMGISPMTTLVVVLVLSLLLMYARIWLGVHTPEQTVAGFLTGLLCTTIPNFIRLTCLNYV